MNLDKDFLIKKTSFCLSISLLIYFLVFDKLNDKIFNVIETIVYKNLSGVIQNYFFNIYSLDLLSKFISGCISIFLCFLLCFIFRNKQIIQVKETSFIDFIYICIFSISLFFVSRFLYSYINSLIGLPTYTNVDNVILMSNQQTVLVFMIISVFLLPIFDELFYRFFLLNFFREINVVFAIFLQALIYCLQFNNLYDIIPYFLLSVILGYFYVIYQNFYFVLMIRMSISFVQNFFDFIQVNKLTHNLYNLDLVIISVIFTGIISCIYILKNFDFSMFNLNDGVISNFSDAVRFFLCSKYVIICLFVLLLYFLTRY